jgi:hypothetical protein
MLDLTKQRFGRWFVMSFSHSDDHDNHWNAVCACGTAKTIRAYDLKSGKSRSCGCQRSQSLRQRFTVHGHNTKRAPSPTYSSWANMIQRCTNPNHKQFADYGGRGVTICERWRWSFENFLADMGLKPLGLLLDRIDNDGNYTPSNCRWTTRLESNRNKRLNYRRGKR